MTVEQFERQSRLPLSKAVRIAWKNIRVRWRRSILVTAGIVLALAFLMYILASESLTRFAATQLSPDDISPERYEELIADVNDAERRNRTRWMVGLALLISFVGILNAMVMSVAERFREIGTMKCLGAFDSLIIKLYLLESLFQGIGGTLVGLAIGLLLAYSEGIYLYGTAAFQLIPLYYLLGLIVVCLLTGAALTVAGAIYPAWVAARMEPVEAMRTEV